MEFQTAAKMEIKTSVVIELKTAAKPESKTAAKVEFATGVKMNKISMPQKQNIIRLKLKPPGGVVYNMLLLFLVLYHMLLL